MGAVTINEYVAHLTNIFTMGWLLDWLAGYVRIYLLLNRWTNQKMLLQGLFTICERKKKMGEKNWSKSAKKCQKEHRRRLASGREAPFASSIYMYLTNYKLKSHLKHGGSGYHNGRQTQTFRQAYHCIDYYRVYKCQILWWNISYLILVEFFSLLHFNSNLTLPITCLKYLSSRWF